MPRPTMKESADILLHEAEYGHPCEAVEPSAVPKSCAACEEVCEAMKVAAQACRAMKHLNSAFSILAATEEINPDNYDHELVVELNEAATRAFMELKKARRLVAVEAP